MRRLMVIADWFYPGYKAGGPIRSCVNLVEMLKDSFEIYVVCSDRDLGDEKPYDGITPNAWNRTVISGVSVYYASSLGMSRLKTLIRDVDPDVVHLNHLFSPAYVLLPLFLKFTGFYHKKVVLSPRGALFDGALSVKPYKKIPFMAVFKMTGLPHRIVFHATNERESLVIKKHFGDVSVMIADNPSSSEKHSLEKIAKAEGCLHLVYIARLHPIKNLKFILDVISRITDVDIHLQVYGPEEDRSYWATCQQVIAAMPANIRVDYGGPISNKEVLAEISKSQLFVLPTTGENFGHSIFESLKAGRPVLISDRTPWRDLQAKRIGWDLPLEEPAQWENAIRSAGKWGQDEMDRYSVAAWSFARDYEEGSVLKQKYIELFS